ncbi:major facilitator superfamily domain-containing protein [Fennellomyces sp. T-0311]|nr:major facilitator superfamily domain-containing protein [Fennellomyces sp. T-0311]
MVSNDTVPQESQGYNGTKEHENTCTIEDKEAACSTLDRSADNADGKRAWIVASGTFLLSLLGGLGDTWGIMQDYYQRTNTFNSGTNLSVELTLVGVLHQAMGYCLMFFTNILYSHIGQRWLLIIGLITSTGGLLLASLATSVWHLYLTFGICTPFGIAATSTVINRNIPSWFVKHRSMVFGIQTSMFAVSALVFPFMMIPINNTLGAPWTYRILGFIFFVINGIGTILVKERLPMIKEDQPREQVSDSVNILKNFNFILWLLWAPIQLSVSFAPSTFLPSYATYVGLSDVQGGAIVSVLSAMSTIGGVVVGMIGDKAGNVNTQLVSTTISTICVFIIWMLAYNFTTLIVFVLIIGFVFQSYFAMSMPILIAAVGMSRYPAALGIGMPSLALGTCGPLLISYVESISDREPFFYCKIIAGVSYGVCAVLLLILKFRLNRSILVKI